MKKNPVNKKILQRNTWDYSRISLLSLTNYPCNPFSIENTAVLKRAHANNRECSLCWTDLWFKFGNNSLTISRRWCNGSHVCLPSRRSGFESQPTYHFLFFLYHPLSLKNNLQNVVVKQNYNRDTLTIGPDGVCLQDRWK